MTSKLKYKVEAINGFTKSIYVINPFDSYGYNKWRDALKPTQILSKLCKDNKLELPIYQHDRVIIGEFCMTFSLEEVQTWNGSTFKSNLNEHLALAVLHRWSEIPVIGCKVIGNISIKVDFNLDS